MSALNLPTSIPRWKRGLDLAIIVCLLPLLLPVAAAIVAWVKLNSRGPVLFRQERIGHRGRFFTIYKIRSMEENAPVAQHEEHFTELVVSNRPMQKLDTLADPRLIRGGRFLRSTGLDELPQLINVIRGEMSLVGPRPCLPTEYAHFTAYQRKRFEATPGLTGYWQVNGKNHTTFAEMIELDLHYLRNRSPWLDMSIMIQTPVVMAAQVIEHGFVPGPGGSKALASEGSEPQSSY